jgi:hypothetical protein
MGKVSAQLFDGIPRVLAELLEDFYFYTSVLAKCWFYPWTDGRWGRGLMILRGIAGALPAGDVFRFGDKIKAGEMIWVRLIDRHDGLFWFLQNIHDGYLLGFLKERGLGPRCKGLGETLFARIGLADSGDMIGSRI